jgi:hypothetical protein
MSDYPNSGSIFEAELPKKSETHPDREGSAEITCPHCSQKSSWWVNGWLKKSERTGKRFLSISFKPKEAAKAKPKQPAFEDSMADDGIPF